MMVNAFRTPNKRQGATLTILMICVTPVLLAAMFCALSAATLVEARVSLQNAGDAAAVAGAQALVDDRWLTGDPGQQLAVIGNARSQAGFFAAQNRVVAMPLSLQLPASSTDLANPRDGDVVFAFLDQPRSVDPRERVLIAHDRDGKQYGKPFLSLVNTVHINARRIAARNTTIPLLGGLFTGITSADVATISTATLDRDAIGFRPTVSQSAPLVPIALLMGASSQPSSWDNELLKGNDQFRCNASTNEFGPGNDGLLEAKMMLKNDETTASSALLLLGIADLATPTEQTTFHSQIKLGVFTKDLQDLGGAFSLAKTTNTLTISATRGVNELYAGLANQLNLIRGQKRIWPLYRTFDSSSGRMVITGFVAARLISAVASSDSLTLVLQPCMLCTHTAITSAAQRDVAGVKIQNPYICKVRLVEESRGGKYPICRRRSRI